MSDQEYEQNPMPEELPESVKKALKEDPAQTVAPPQLTLQETPIPDPNLPKDNKPE